MSALRIADRRLLHDLAELATFGGRMDGGVDRIAGSPADIASRAWLVRRIEDAGLEACTDSAGNVFGRRPGSTGPWLLTGSHSDTVPAGGRLDGAYGVIASLEALRTLHEQDHPAADAVEVVVFWDEEGVAPTSPGGLVGSTALVGSEHIDDVSAFLELHIEQGPRMERAGQELAVVDGIVGIDRHLVTVHGEANHAGTTPMSARADAGRAAARIAGQIREIAGEVSELMVANVGCIEFRPGAPNVVPGEAVLTVEFRAPDESSLDQAAGRLVAFSQSVVAGEGCTAQIDRLSRKPVVRFDEDMIHSIEKTCRATRARTGRLTSFAGHDASVLSSRVPTAMLFVPSTNGISHAPAEHTPERLLVQGAQVLLDALIELGRTRPRHPKLAK